MTATATATLTRQRQFALADALFRHHARWARNWANPEGLGYQRAHEQHKWLDIAANVRQTVAPLTATDARERAVAVLLHAAVGCNRSAFEAEAPATRHWYYRFARAGLAVLKPSGVDLGALTPLG